MSHIGLFNQFLFCRTKVLEILLKSVSFLVVSQIILKNVFSMITSTMSKNSSSRKTFL